jgi:hypothetical protein
MERHKIVSKSYVESKTLTIGIILGAAIGIGVENVTINILDLLYPIPKEIVCQKGKLFEQAEWGGTVYLKTETECLETALEELK